MDVNLEHCPVADLRLEKYFNKYALSIRTGEYYEFDYSKISNQLHHHDCYELVIVIKGGGVFRYEDREHRLKEGDLFLSEPGKAHEIHIDKNKTMVLYYILFELAETPQRRSVGIEEKLMDRFLGNHGNIARGRNELLGYFLLFEEYAARKGYRGSPWFLRIVEAFLFHCLEAFCDPDVFDRAGEILTGDLFEKALDFIDKNLAHKITAASVAEGVNTSKRNLYRLFDKNLNRPVNDYVNERKMHLAATYLKMNLSVSEAAGLAGMENLSQFSKLFRRYMGVSPREFKKRHRENAAGFGRRLERS